LTSQPPPLPYESPPPPLPARPRLTFATAAAWVVILATVAFIVATVAIEKNAVPPGESPAAEVGARILPRYAVGVHHTLSALQPPGAESQAVALLPQVDDTAVTRDERIRAAIVAGEIGGPPAASQRLDRIPIEPSPEGDDLHGLRAIYAAGNADPLTPGERAALSDRHGWFGQLALSYGQSGDDPRRIAALRPAVRTAVVAIGAMFAGMLAMVVGLVILVVTLVRWTGGTLTVRYRPAPTPTGPFLEAFAVYVAGMVALSAIAHWLLGERPMASWLVLAILPLTFFWPLLRGVSRDDWRRGLGWHTGRGVWREIGAGIVGYLGGLPVLAAGALFSVVLQRFSDSDTSHPIVNELGRDAWRTARLFFLAAVWAPVVEETMFRGAFYHHLRARLPWPAASAVVALLFAAVHPQGWAAIPVLGGIAMSLATIREWRGSIIAPTVAHAINNGVVTILLVLLLA
jgi:membrane protease YdiL (CAAX protease family)